MFENFPYTNFHELNLDWLLDRMKKNSEDQEALKKYVDDVFSGIGNMQGEGWLKNKKIVVYGDSTTQIENSYIKKLSDYGAIITNRGVYGTAIVTNNDKTGAIDLIPKAEDLNDFDYIFMCYGAYDLGGWDYNFPFEESIETSDNYLNYCLKTIFEFLKTKTCYPIFILPPIVHQDSWGDAQTNAYNGSTQDLFNDTVVAICEQYHIEYFNLFTLCPVNHENYTYWYLQDNTQGIWIHPNNRLNTVIFNQILSRNSNNGYCYPGEWTDCSEVIASPTQHELFTPIIANMPSRVIKKAVFFKNYQSTPFFSISSNDGSPIKLRISGIFTSNADNFGQQQIIYRENKTNKESRLCLFSRQKNNTSITFELDEGLYQFGFYNTNKNNIAAINLKLEIQNGHIAPFAFTFKPSNLVSKSDLKIYFLRDEVKIEGCGLQIAATGAVESGTVLLESYDAFTLDPGDNPFIYFVTGNDIKICQWRNDAIVALDSIPNNLRISTATKNIPYRNLFDL
jgi:hypothetical protein